MQHSTPPFTALADLASARVGGRAIAANDDFFAPKSNLVKPEPAIFVPGKFTTRGKWMDGWESRRRRTPGHDWCVARARHARPHRRRGRRHELLHRQLSVALLDRRARRHSRAVAGAGCTGRGAVGDHPARSPRCAATATTTSRFSSREPWTHLRLNIYPGRRRRAAARPRRRRRGLEGRVAQRRGRSIWPRSATAAWCSARATCTSAPRTT